jgi:hypothetical protein
MERPAEAQRFQSVQLPEELPVLDLQRAPDGTPVVVRATGVLIFERGNSPVEVAFDGRAEEAAILSVGLIYVLAGDTLSVVTQGRSFEELLQVPGRGMQLSTGRLDQLFLYGGDEVEAGTADETIYELRRGNQLRRLAVLPERVTDVAAIDDTMWFATRRSIFRLSEGEIEPFFVSDEITEITDIAATASGGLLIASKDGIFEIRPDGRGARRLSDQPATKVHGSRDVVYAIFYEGTYLAALDLQNE